MKTTHTEENDDVSDLSTSNNKAKRLYSTAFAEDQEVHETTVKPAKKHKNSVDESTSGYSNQVSSETNDQTNKILPQSDNVVVSEMKSLENAKKYKQSDEFNSNRTVLKNHQSAHRGKNTLSCTWCKFNFTRKDSLVSHKRNGNRLNCEECNKRFCNHQSLHKHMICYHMKTSIYCKVCNIKFSNRKTLYIHARQKSHLGEDVFLIAMKMCQLFAP